MLDVLKANRYFYKKENPEITEFEVFSENFQNNIKYISNVRFVYGGCFDVPDQYSIDIIGDKAILVYSIDDEDEMVHGNIEIDKTVFMESLSNHNIGNWKKHCYSCCLSDTEERYELASATSRFILDGYSWDLYITYSNDSRRISFYGSNFYHEGFRDLELLFRDLTDEEVLKMPTYVETVKEMIINRYKNGK